jgi:hypothetical protein
MPTDALDRELAEELCLGSRSALANDNARPDYCGLRAVAHTYAEPEATAVSPLAAKLRWR